MWGLCGAYVGLMWGLCGAYVGLCGAYVVLMWCLCGTYAGLMWSLCGAYVGVSGWRAGGFRDMATLAYVGLYVGLCRPMSAYV